MKYKQSIIFVNKRWKDTEGFFLWIFNIAQRFFTKRPFTYTTLKFRSV